MKNLFSFLLLLLEFLVSWWLFNPQKYISEPSLGLLSWGFSFKNLPRSLLNAPLLYDVTFGVIREHLHACVLKKGGLTQSTSGKFMSVPQRSSETQPLGGGGCTVSCKHVFTKHRACPLTTSCMPHRSLLTLEHRHPQFHWCTETAGDHRSNPDVLIHSHIVGGSHSLFQDYAHVIRAAHGGSPTSHGFCP